MSNRKRDIATKAEVACRVSLYKEKTDISKLIDRELCVIGFLLKLVRSGVVGFSEWSATLSITLLAQITMAPDEKIKFSLSLAM